MLQVEFHSHTIYSKDSLSAPGKVIETCHKKGIDRIVITDHNTITGALEAVKIDPELVIVGEEIMTTKGELLAAFVREEVPEGLTPLEAIDRLRGQDAFISVSRPFDRWRSGHWKVEDLTEILPHIDAIEIFNARCMLPGFNKQAIDFAKQHNIPGTVGSDAHALVEIGKATFSVPDFNDAESLRDALPHAIYHTSLSAPWIHFTSRYAVWRKKFDNNLVYHTKKP